MTTAPSLPALAAMPRIGSSRARRKMLTPVWISPWAWTASSAERALIRATPPPGTMPSSTAARVALKASSTRCFFSLSSVSVAAPTLITATPPASLASRSCSFSRSKSEVVVSIWVRICSMRPLIVSGSPAPSMNVVSSLVETTRRARPRSSSVALSSRRPTSSEMTWPPVRAAMSRSISLRRSPKPGALVARTFRVPRSLLTTRVASASPSTSSAMIMSGARAAATFSRTGRMSWIEEIFLSVIRINGSSSSASIRSGLVTKYGEMYPRSICMPSVYSVSKSSPLDSSTVITPSLPTFSITSAMRLPISESAAEIAATWAISSLPFTGVAISWSFWTRAADPRSMPCLSSMALAPAATLRIPSWTMAWASTIAVVVPSPATSLVFVAASLSSCAPILAKWLSSAISLATVTPSWVTVGAPYFLSSATLRPLGPSVVLTALASVSTPSFKDWRAAVLNSRILAILRNLLYLLRRCRYASLVRDDRQDVLLGQDQQILVVELELSAGILGEEHFIAGRDIHRDAIAVLVATAVTDRDDRATLRLFLDRVRDDDPRFGRFLAVRRTHHHAVPKWAQLRRDLGSIRLRRRHIRFLQPDRLTEPPPGYRFPSQLQPTRA